MASALHMSNECSSDTLDDMDIRPPEHSKGTGEMLSLGRCWHELVEGHVPDSASTKVNTTNIHSEELYDCFVGELEGWQSVHEEAHLELDVLHNHFSETQIQPWMTGELLDQGEQAKNWIRDIVDTRIKDHITRHLSALTKLEATDEARGSRTQETFMELIQHHIMQEALVLDCRRQREKYFETYWHLNDDHELWMWEQKFPQRRQKTERRKSEDVEARRAEWPGFRKLC